VLMAGLVLIAFAVQRPVLARHDEQRIGH
jgi:hypothetical protein